MKELKEKLKVFFGKHFYVILLLYAFAFLVFYLVYSLSTTFKNSLTDYEGLIDFLKTLSVLAFTGGIFTVSLRYIQYLGVFEKEFDRIVHSPKFNEKLKETISAITFSEEFLNKQNDLNDIWKKVTLSKYQREFPELYSKVRKNIENELFKNNSLTKYYKNVQISYELELLEGHRIKVKEFSSFTIIRNKTREFTWDFFLSYASKTKAEDSDGEDLLVADKTKIDGTLIDMGKCKILSEEENEKFVRKHYSYELNGKKEYHIERCFEFEQDLKEDRVIAFDSSHVIDDLSIFIMSCDDLEIVFEPSGKNKFYKNEIFSNRHSYINRDVFLPGEKYKLFVFKKK